MNKKEFNNWMERTGYTDINDWNHQRIDDCYYYFIKNHEKNLYALIKQDIVNDDYQIVVREWKDYNNWGESK